MPIICDIRAFPFDVELNQPFGIATGTQVVARNVLVELELEDGTVGLGEAAPFEAVSGETQGAVLEALGDLGPRLIGQDARAYRALSERLWDGEAPVPTAIAALETALLDALSRRANTSLLHFFGGASSRLHTDITLPTTDDSDPVVVAVQGARRAQDAGFTQLKIKVGKDDLDTDIRRVLAVTEAAPGARLLLDANGAYDVSNALRLLEGLGEARQKVALFEQPVARDDWAGLLEVESKGSVLVCADESFRDAADLRRLTRQGGPGAVNIKTAKSGLLRGWELAVSAKSLGFRLMIGGMVETELSMTASACLAAGVGGFDFVDLDTPLFMRERPLQGGFVQRGPELELAGITRGHGVSWIRG